MQKIKYSNSIYNMVKSKEACFFRGQFKHVYNGNTLKIDNYKVWSREYRYENIKNCG